MKREPSNMGIFALFVIVILVGVAVSHRTKAAPRYYDEQLLNYRYTEFCATVGKPPAALAEALNQAVGVDPQKWLPAIQWWNKIAEKYAEARCGDA
jgi:hypothetical protein